MIRVVPVSERFWGLGWLVGIVGGAILLHAVSFADFPTRFAEAGLGLFFWNLGPFLVGRRGPWLATLDDAVASVPLLVTGVDAAIVRAKSGVSVAMAWAGGGAFFETDDRDEAARLVARTHARLDGPVKMTTRHRAYRVLTRLVSLVGLTGGLAYFVFVGLLGDLDFRERTAIPSLACGVLGSLLHVVGHLTRPRVRVGTVLGDHGRVREHFAAHAAIAPAPETPETPETRFRVLVREGGDAAAWISRLDAIGAAGEGYRGDAPTREELRAVVADRSLASDVRLAAVRVLVRKHGVSPSELLGDLEPELAPWAFDIVGDDAPAKLERRGPLFRA